MGIVRILLSLSIIIHHSFPLFGLTILGRDPALEAFYIVSGFYMSLILNEKYIGDNGTYKLFITNRFLRIFPTYWLILMVTVLFNYYYLHQNYFQNSFWYILRDVTLLIRGDYLSISTYSREAITLGQAYTLILELCFYIFAPFLCRKSLRFTINLSIIAFISHFLVLALVRYKKLPLGDWFFPEVIIFFLMGILAYHIYTYIKTKNISYKILGTIFVGFFLLTLTYNFNFIPEFQITSIFHLRIWLYLICVALCVPFIFKLTNRIHIDRFLGELSYPMFLAHPVIINFLLATTPLKLQNSTTTLTIILATIAISFMIFFFFEKPIEQFRQKRLIHLSAKTNNGEKKNKMSMK